jgi:hypothetical protein
VAAFVSSAMDVPAQCAGRAVGVVLRADPSVLYRIDRACRVLTWGRPPSVLCSAASAWLCHVVASLLFAVLGVQQL